MLATVKTSSNGVSASNENFSLILMVVNSNLFSVAHKLVITSHGSFLVPTMSEYTPNRTIYWESRNLKVEVGHAAGRVSGQGIEDLAP